MSLLARWGDWVEAELLPVFRRKSATQDRDHRSLTKPSPTSRSPSGITRHQDPPPFNNSSHLETRLPAETQEPLKKLLTLGIPAIPLCGPIWEGQKKRAKRWTGSWVTKSPVHCPQQWLPPSPTLQWPAPASCMPPSPKGSGIRST